MRADIHDGPEHMLQSEAGYIDARPLTPARQNLLQRTAGPYIWVILVDSGISATCPVWEQFRKCWRAVERVTSGVVQTPKLGWITRSTNATVRAQQLCAAFGDGDDQPKTGDGFALDKTAIDRVLPDRQPRARRAPGRDHLGIKPRLARDPFDEIEHQRICGLSHRISPVKKQRHCCARAKASFRKGCRSWHRGGSPR